MSSSAAIAAAKSATSSNNKRRTMPAFKYHHDAPHQALGSFSNGARQLNQFPLLKFLRFVASLEFWRHALPTILISVHAKLFDELLRADAHALALVRGTPLKKKGRAVREQKGKKKQTSLKTKRIEENMVSQPSPWHWASTRVGNALVKMRMSRFEGMLL